MWPHCALVALAQAVPAGPLWPVALGAVGEAAGVDDHGVALVAAQAAVSTPAWAATRLLGLDPLAVARCLADLAPAVDLAASEAPATAARHPDTWPAATAPLNDIGAEHHATWEVRLFVS